MTCKYFQSQVAPQHNEDTDERAQSTGKSFRPTNQSVTQPRFWTPFPPQIVHMGGSLKPNVSSQSLAGRAKVEECSLALSSCCISFWHNLACMHRSKDVIRFCKMCFQLLGHNMLFAWHRTILSEHSIASCFLVTSACTLFICTFLPVSTDEEVFYFQKNCPTIHPTKMIIHHSLVFLIHCCCPIHSFKPILPIHSCQSCDRASIRSVAVSLQPSLDPIHLAVSLRPPFARINL